MINTIKKENQQKRGFHMALGCRIRRNFERPSKELVEAFRGIPVANIDDNCGRIAAVDSSIFPLNPKARLLGTAFTVNAPAGDNLLFHKALDMAQPGDVIVLANKGSLSSPGDMRSDDAVFSLEKRIIPLDRLSRNNIKTSSINLPTIQSICQILLNNKLTTAVVDKDNSILLPLFARTITSPG